MFKHFYKREHFQSQMNKVVVNLWEHLLDYVL